MGNTGSHSCHISCTEFIHHFMSLKFRLQISENESGVTHYRESVKLLERQRHDCEYVISGDSLDDHFTSLQYGLKLLGDISYFLRRNGGNENLRMRIESLLYEVRLKLHSLSGRPKNGRHLDRGYTNLRDMMKNVLINPETGEYDVPLGFPAFGRPDFEDLLSMFDRISNYITDAIVIESLKKKVMLLELFAGYNYEHLGPLGAFVEKAICLIYPYLLDRKNDETTLAMMKKLTDLVENLNFKPICIEIITNLGRRNEFEFLDTLTRLIPFYAIIYRNVSDEKLHEKLKFLETFIPNLPRELLLEKFNYFERSFEKITRNTLHIIFSCYKKDMAREDYEAISELIDQIEDVIQAEVQVIKLCNYPKTDGLGFLDLFLEHLEELMKFQPEVIEITKSQIKSLHVDFDFLRNFLKKINEQHDENEEIRDLSLHILDLAYQAEYIIDIYLAKFAPDSRIMFSLSKIIEQTKLIKSEATNIYEDEKYYSRAHNVAKIPSNVTSQAIGKATDEVVGFDDEAEKIKEFLFGDNIERDIVSIVGLPGLGKTTLARKLYEEHTLIEHFHVRGWCTASQTYHTRDMLLTIIDDVIGITEEINQMNDEDLAAKLYQSLKGRRYFIIIDDLWHVEAWNSLVRSLPNDKNHSRVLITSRLQIVAPQTRVGRKVHFLRGFSSHESWELLQRKLSQNGSFSQEILTVGKQIAESCKGLPLAIVVIASLLVKTEKNADKWKEIADNLSSYILSDAESQCKAIFEMSYTNLPAHLKSCFLYFGAFAEDEEIPLSKLKRLWIAEGFVRNTKTKSLEDVAQEYCLDLISRSLVISTTESSSGGGVKACRVHDLLRDFCLKKAQEESFLRVINFDDVSDSSKVYDEHRLSILSEREFSSEVNLFGCSVRSLHRNGSFRHIHNFFENFRLLKVLDLDGSDSGEHFSKIELLVHLRYLAVQARKVNIPSSISNLWNLQFLLVRPFRYGLVGSLVLDSLWDMVNLRQVKIFGYFEVKYKRYENSILSENLEKLSTPMFKVKEDAEELLRRLPKLTKLSCIIDIYPDDKENNQCLDLSFLHQLISLKVAYDVLTTIKLNFPSNLRKLSLLNVRREYNEISEIGRTLPNLEVLKLFNHKLSGTWFVEDWDFPKLKYLALRRMNKLDEWIASTDSFPNLEKLYVGNCKALREIPPCFGEIQTLQRVTIKWCNSDVDDSAIRIQREQREEWMNDEFKLYITRSTKYV